MAYNQNLRAFSFPRRNPHLQYEGRWNTIQPIYKAVMAGNASALKEMLWLKTKINIKMKGGYTPLHIAVYERQLECFNLLLSAGARPDISDNLGMRPLHYAAQNGDVVIVMKLSKYCHTINLQDNQNCTPLHYAVGGKWLRCVDILLHAGASVDVQDKEGWTSLHIAARYGYVNIIKKLLSRCSNIDLQAKDKCTALQIALLSRHQNVACVLLDAGASAGIQNDTMPLHIAVQQGYDNIIRKMLQQNIDVNVCDAIHGNTPLHISLIQGKLGYIDDLLCAGAHVDIQNSNGATPLHIALAMGYKDIANKMLELKPNVNIKDVKHPLGRHVNRTEFGYDYEDMLVGGRTPLHIAVKKGFDCIVKKLLDLKADVNVQDANQCTPLHVAVREHELRCIDVLLNAGSNVDIQDCKGRTVLHIAVEQHYDDVITKLLDLKADTNIQDMNQSTPLHIAVRECEICCMDALLNVGGNVDMQDGMSRAPLHITVEQHYDDIVREFLDLKADTSIQDINQCTPLHVAVGYEKLNCVDALINAGADLSIKDRRNLTPLCIAVEQKNISIWKKMLDIRPQILRDNVVMFRMFETIIVNDRLDMFDYLLEAGANVNVRNNDEFDDDDEENTTLLHVAAQYGSENMMQKLLQVNRDVNEQDIGGDTALHIACKELKLNHILLLLDAGARWDIRDDEERTMMWYLIDYLSFSEHEDEGDFKVLKKILDITNDGKPIDHNTQESATHLLFRQIFVLDYYNEFEIVETEIMKLVVSTQKDLSVKDRCDHTVLHNILNKSYIPKIIVELTRMCIERGAYLTCLDCDDIICRSAIRDDILRDKDLCTKSIANEFNNNMLPKFYEHVDNDTWIVPIEALRINPGSMMWRVTEEDVRSEIEKKGYCDPSRLMTTSLSKRCVESYCKEFGLCAQHVHSQDCKITSQNFESDSDSDHYYRLGYGFYGSDNELYDSDVDYITRLIFN